MTAPVVPLRPADDIGAAAREALGAVSRHLDRCKLATHVASLMTKLGARNRVEIAMWAYDTRRVRAD